MKMTLKQQASKYLTPTVVIIYSKLRDIDHN